MEPKKHFVEELIGAHPFLILWRSVIRYIYLQVPFSFDNKKHLNFYFWFVAWTSRKYTQTSIKDVDTNEDMLGLYSHGEWKFICRTFCY